MTSIFCSIITQLVRDIAKEYNKLLPHNLSDAYVNNMISVWQSANKTSNMPTALDLKKYFLDAGLQLRLQNAYFAVPRHLFVEHNPNDRVMVRTNIQAGNMITILKLPDVNPLGYFFNVFKDYPLLQDIIETTLEAYQFLLWRELYFIMYNDAFRKDKKKEAFEFAYLKAKKWKELHHVLIIQEDTNSNPQPSNILPQATLPQQPKPLVEPLPITRIISGGLTGIDTLGLLIAREFGIETGGNAPIGYLRESNQDDITSDMLRQWGLTEVNREEEKKYLLKNGNSLKDPYNYRTYLNVKNSDGTVYFAANVGRSVGLKPTRDAANRLGKPFLLNPTALLLREWCINNNIKTLNIAGSRGSHQTQVSRDIANNVLRAALAGNNKNAQLVQQELPKSAKIGDKTISISTQGYRKGDPQKNPNIAFVFTENAEAYGYSNGIDVTYGREFEFPFKGTPKINVSDVNGTNQAGIRTDASGNISKNAFGIVVKKYQHGHDGRFVALEGTFLDTVSDFDLFTSLNTNMFKRLEESGLKEIIFPSQMGLGKAALPRRLAEWLADLLSNRFNIVSEIKLNTKAGYEGFGLQLIGLLTDENQALNDSEDLERLDYEIRSRAYQQAVERNKQLQQQLSIGKPAPEGITSNGVLGQMNKSFGNDKRPEVVSDNTIDAIRRGERTATTRFGLAGNKNDRIDYWALRKVGDIVLFYDDNTNTAVYVRITKALTQLPRHATKEQVEEWSKKEGWSTDHYLHYIQNRASQGLAWQMEYEYIGDAPMSAVKRKAAPIYTDAALTPELLKEEQQKADALRATGEYVTPSVQRITAALANDPNYTPKIDISKVTDLGSVSKRINLIRDFTSQQLKDRTELMARDFSDIVNSIVEEMTEERVDRQNQIMSLIEKLHSKGNLNQDELELYRDLRLEFDELTDLLDTLRDGTFGRRYAIEKYGIENIIEDLKLRYTENAGLSVEELDNAYGDGRGAYIKVQLQKVVDNFDELLDDASIIIEGAEKLRLSTKYISRDNGPEEGGEIKNSADIFESPEEKEQKEAALSDDEDGSRLTGNDGWSYKVRFVDPLTSLSKEVRGIIGNIIRRRPVIRKVEKNGRIIEETEWVAETDDLGNIRYLNSEAVHAILISELSSMIDADDFMQKALVWKGNKYVTETTFPALERLVDKYPWVTLVIETLKSDERLASKFFHDFRKDFIPYWMQVFNEPSEKDNSYNRELQRLFKNAEEEEESKDESGWKLLLINRETALDSTITQITRDYELGNVFSAHSIYTPSKEISNENALWVITEVNDIMSELLEIDPDTYDIITLRIAEVLRAVGLNTNRHIVSALLTSKDDTISGLNLTRQLLDAVRSIAQKVQDMPEGSHLIDYFKDDGYYNTIGELIGVVSELDHVQSFRNFDKSYYSYSAPNYIDTCIKKLKSDERRRLFLEQQFKQYDWFYHKATRGDLSYGDQLMLQAGISQQKTLPYAQGVDRKFTHLDLEVGYTPGEWRSEWLRLIEEDEEIRRNLETKEVNTIKFGKDDNDAEYRNWNESKIRQGFVREFFSIGINPKSDNQYAWYNVPIFSDSPVAKFIKFKRYVGDNYKQEIIGHLSTVVKQEIDRIKLVIERKKGIKENSQVQMSNFDKNGDKFHFFPELNDKYIDGRKFIEIVAELVEKGKTDELDALIATSVEEIMEDNFYEFLGDFTDEDREATIAFLKKSGAIATEEGFEEAMRNYFYNQAYATTLIIELTTTDLAYYKDDVDFQKRYKEVYAAGNKLNTNSKYGKKIERVIYLSDLIITSATYNDIKRSLNYAVELGRIQSFDRDNILNKFKDINVADAQAYRSLKSMRSVLDMMGKWDDKMEAALQRFDNGDWDMSDFNLVWQTIKPFMFTQVDKPAYSKEYLDNKLANGEISRKEYDRLRKKRIKVPHQNKNSEFLLMSTYAMVANSLGKSLKLKGLERFMKDNDIDVIQFESAVKAGCLGTIDISYSQSKLDKLYTEHQEPLERAVKQELRKKIIEKLNRSANSNTLLASSADIASDVDKEFKRMSKFDVLKMGADLLLDNGGITQMQYNQWFESIEPSEQEVYDILNSTTKDSNGFREEVVHELPYDDYCIQLPTPEHLFDVSDAVFGSQFRNLIISDLPEDFSVILKGKDGKPREFNKKQIRDLYQANIVENLLEGYQKATDKFQNIRTLLKFLMSQVKGNPKYGRDILDALQIISIPNPSKSGEMIEVFNIPLDNPTTTLKLQELITSVFKNNITKQTINGGACILVSDFGLTKELQVLRDEKTGAITGIECYMPAYSKKFYEPFMVEKPGKDGKTYMELDVSKMPEDLRKLVGYRIPTEDKYSMAPLIIKGFLPQLNGSAIMLPADITQIAGSDFDVDKMFLMIPSFRKIYQYNKKEAWKLFYKENPDIVELIEKTKQEWFESYIEDEIENNPDLEGKLSIDDEKLKKKYFKEIGSPNYEWAIGTKDKFEKWFNQNKQKFYTGYRVEKRKYDLDKTPLEHTKLLRDNLLIDISYAILTHPDTALKINDPGNFDKAKLGARIDSIITNKDLLTKFIEKYNILGSLDLELKKQGKTLHPNNIVLKVASFIENMAENGQLDELNEFIKDNRKQRSLLTLNTFIYNHRLNMTGGALIGMYANNTTMQAKFQASDLRAKQHRSFRINGRELNSLHDAYSQTGERISKNCANFSAASVDNVKDPVLADLLQNRKTANITSLMLRAGMTVNEISLFFALPDVKDLVESRYGLSPRNIGDLVSSLRDELQSKLGPLPSNQDILKEYNVTSQSLMELTIRNTMGLSEFMDEAMQKASVEERANWDDLKKKQELERFKTLVVLCNIVELSEPLGDLTRISRADSPNGAIDISIAGATVLRHRILRFALQSTQREFPLLGTEDIMQMDYLKPNMTIDLMRDKLLEHRMPMLQAFYSLGMDLAFNVMSEYFSQASPFMQDLSDLLLLNAKDGYVKDWAVNRFFSEAITFALSHTTLFGDDPETGDTYESKREYYLYQFPKKFELLLIDNPDLKQIDIIKKLSVDMDTGDIQMYRSGRLTPLMRESLMRSMDLLLFDKDNPKALELAKDLFMYAYYKDGFRFGPNSFGNFFSSNFISCFTEVAKTLRTLKFDMREGTFMDRFLPQFYANHIYDAGLPYITDEDLMRGGALISPNGLLIIKAGDAINNLTKGGFHPVTGKALNPYYQYFRYGDIIYEFSRVGETNAIYIPVYTNIKDDKSTRYNANTTASGIHKQLKERAQRAANRQQTPKLNEQPVANPELDGIQQELAEIAKQRALVALQQQQSSPQLQAANLEASIGSLESIDNMSTSKATEIELNMPDALNNIEEQQRNSRLDEYEHQHWLSIFETIEEQQTIGFEESNIPIVEQYSESDGELALGEIICDDLPS